MDKILIERGEQNKQSTYLSTCREKIYYENDKGDFKIPIRMNISIN